MVQPPLKQVAIDRLVLQIDRGPVVRHECHVLVVRGELLAQGEGGTPAGGAEYDAVSHERFDPLIHALGHGLVVGEQGEVHVRCDELDGGQVGVGEIRGEHVVLSGLGGARFDVRRYCKAWMPHIGAKAA